MGLRTGVRGGGNKSGGLRLRPAACACLQAGAGADILFYPAGRRALSSLPRTDRALAAAALALAREIGRRIVRGTGARCGKSRRRRSSSRRLPPGLSPVGCIRMLRIHPIGGATPWAYIYICARRCPCPPLTLPPGCRTASGRGCGQCQVAALRGLTRFSCSSEWLTRRRRRLEHDMATHAARATVPGRLTCRDLYASDHNVTRSSRHVSPLTLRTHSTNSSFATGNVPGGRVWARAVASHMSRTGVHRRANPGLEVLAMARRKGSARSVVMTSLLIAEPQHAAEVREACGKLQAWAQQQQVRRA
eukprot:scaffold7_cov378-Prasinococcus_capsulatus_cf.AAC.20